MTTIDALNSDQQPTPASQRAYWLLYGLALLIRIVLAFTFGTQAPKIVDAIDYDGLAARLLESGNYASESGELTSLRPPLYAGFLAAIYFLFGTHNYLAVSLVQSVVSLLTAMLGHLLGSKLMGPKAGWTVGIILAFYPSLLAFNCLTLSETLFTFWFVLAVLLSVQFQAKPTWRLAILMGISLGLGALTRSVLWVCVPPIFLYLLVTSTEHWYLRVAKLSVAMLVFGMVLAPWAWRNTHLQKTFTLIDVMGGRNVMMGNYEFTPLERSWATITDVTGERAWHRVLANDTAEYSSKTQGQIDKLAMKYGIKYFFAHPTQSTVRCLVRFFNFWQLERELIAGAHQGLWGQVSKISLALLAIVILGGYASVILPAIGGFFISDIEWKQHGLLLLWLALPCAVHTVAFAHSRYHLPMIPLVACYAAPFWVAAFQHDLARLKKAALYGGPLALLLILGWARELIMVDLAVFMK
jgi:4-amino-4-deoxy-L-arabinose transferase-like glycosyltransferase